MGKKMQTMDGNKAAAYVSYAFTEVAAIYPITPSSTMAEHMDEWSAQGKKNIFGQPVKVVEMQSEGGAAGAMHGSLSAGALTSSYTASQGLLLMIPNMYKMAGELLPGVLHVTARTLSTHTLSIFGDHSDVMACAQTGFAMLASGSVQECMDLAGVAHLAAIKGRVPFMHFFDGFRTSHEQQKIEVMEYDDLAKLVDYDALQKFRENALNPEHPVVRGTNQNPDIYFQSREACSPFYQALPAIVAEYMEEISKITGRSYHPFDYYGAADADRVLVAMGSICEVAEQAVDYLNSCGQKVGLIKVRLYRPFATEYFLNVLPKTVKKIAVIDRLKTPGAAGEPLYLDVVAALQGADVQPEVVGGRYGLASKDTVPGDIVAVFDNLNADQPKHGFTIAINDDISFTSLERKDVPDMLPKGTIQCKFWGLGSDGTVGANKQAVDIIGTYTDMYAQAYFSYDSKKSGGLTVSHLRFGDDPIHAPYLINAADFISCSNRAYVNTYDLLEGLKPGGIFLLNTRWTQAELEEKLPAAMKKYIGENNIRFCIIDAVDIAKNLGLGNRTNMVMQAAFFKLSQVIPEETAVKALKDAIVKAYGRKGEKVVNMNYQAVDAGMTSVEEVTVPAHWKDIVIEAKENHSDDLFIENIFKPLEANKGDTLPVSAFKGREDGSFPLGGSKLEKRGVATTVPEWHPENCIQCNQCSFICPHAAIRPFLMTEEEKAAAPEGMTTLKAIGKGLEGMQYRMQVSPLDCLGCGCCVVVCPAKEKALTMENFASQSPTEAPNWDYLVNIPIKDELVPANNVKNSQFQQPLLEFSGACAGCGETPYAKLVTQLVGDRMYIANATGCSSIWGAAVPAMPFCTNKNGCGPAWSNSLFEDNAEFGLGMALAVKQLRQRLADLMIQAKENGIDPELAAAFDMWLAAPDDADNSKSATKAMLPLLEKATDPILKQIYDHRDHLVKKSFWAFGGDGWAYDIGYGGLDHVLASGEDINVLVFDTEVYSNTGGQSSKATPTAAIAKFAASGKRTKKKDLGMMAMSYGYVYVAQIAIGADMAHALKTIKEAESYPGPSLIIAYSSCVNHGIKTGMSTSMTEMKKAVDSGYWHLYRYNPALAEEGKNPFSLDSKEPTLPIKDFLLGEVRYASLAQLYPEKAEELFAKTEQDAKLRYEKYRGLAGK